MLLKRLTASAVAAVIAMGVVLSIRSWDAVATTKDDVPIWEIFFSLFGLVYAIIVGLFIIEAHRRMRELSTIVQSELNAVGDLEDFLEYFRENEHEAAAEEVRDRLRIYASSLIADLEQPKKAPKEQAQERRREIASIIDAVMALEPPEAGTASESALDAIVRKIADLTTFRSQKTEMARRGFPGLFYGLLAVMTAVVVVGFSVMAVPSKGLHYVFVTVTAAALTWLVTLVWDVDHPLEGYWNIREEVSNVAETIGGSKTSYSPGRQAGSSKNISVRPQHK
jgi:hypothetical protein